MKTSKVLRRGSILLELIVGTGLLAAGLLAIFGGLTFTSRSLGLITQRNLALNLTMNRLGAIRAQSYDSLVVGLASQPIDDLPAGSLQTTITQLSADTKQVTVQTFWDTSQRKVELITIVAQAGIESL